MSAKLRIGSWDADPAACTIVVGNTSTKLTPRSMSVLVHLAENAGEVVTSEALLAAFWPRTVTSPNAVYKVITELRDALRADPGETAHIETVPKRGYRLVAKVEAMTTAPVNAPLIANGTAALSNGAEGPGHPDSAATHEPSATHHQTNGTAEATTNGTGLSRFALPRRAAPIAVAFVLLSIAGIALSRFWAPATHWIFETTGWCATTCSTVPATLAILPFENLSGDPANAYLGEAMAVALTEGIARSKEISLTHPGVAVRQQTEGRSAADVAATLGVDNLLRGTVQRSGERLRVTLELVRATDEVSLYSGSFDDSVDHLFELQDDMSEVVGKALSVHLDPFQRAHMIAGGTTNVEAYLAVQEAHFHYRRPMREDAMKTIEIARRAVALDPKYVDAYWCLVVGLSNLASNALLTGRMTAGQFAEVVEEIRSIARQAAKEIPESGVDYATKAELAEMTNDLVGREVALRELIKAQQSPVRRHMKPEGFYARLLRGAGLFDDAKAFSWLEVELRDNGTTWLWEDPVVTLLREGPAPVIARYKAAVNENPQDISTLSGLIQLLAREGQYRESEQYLESLTAADPSGAWSTHAKAMLDIRQGRLKTNSPELAAFLADPRTSRISAGTILFMLGNLDGGVERWDAFDAPERAFLHANRHYIEYHMPQTVVADPRYQALLDRLGMGAQWRHYLEDKVRELEPYTGIRLAADHPGSRPPGEWRWKL